MTLRPSTETAHLVSYAADGPRSVLVLYQASSTPGTRQVTSKLEGSTLKLRVRFRYPAVIINADSHGSCLRVPLPTPIRRLRVVNLKSLHPVAREDVGGDEELPTSLEVCRRQLSGAPPPHGYGAFALTPRPPRERP